MELIEIMNYIGTVLAPIAIIGMEYGVSPYRKEFRKARTNVINTLESIDELSVNEVLKTYIQFEEAFMSTIYGRKTGNLIKEFENRIRSKVESEYTYGDTSTPPYLFQTSNRKNFFLEDLLAESYNRLNQVND